MDTQISYKVYGKYALFTDPITKVGGEKFTYPIPTYEALKGITESIYWKPTITWVIDAVRIMKNIETEAKNMRPIYYTGGNTLSIYTYLSNVEYQVKAHFVWNENRPDLKQDRNLMKHLAITQRMIERGGRRDIFLGTRECQGYVESCEFGTGEGYYDDVSMDFSLMLHGLTYPDEGDIKNLYARLWLPRMRNGVIEFIKPEECEIKRLVKASEMKIFSIGKNYSME